MGAVAALLAVLWFSVHRPDIPYPVLEQRYATAQSRFIDLPGGEHVHVRVVEPGPGAAPAAPPLVLVHGFAASGRDWDDWAARLSSHRRIVVLDLPGHGLTRTPPGYAASSDGFVRVVDGVATALALPPFVIAGNSMGGGVAWRYALAHPDRVKGLVLVDAAGWARPSGAAPGAVRLMGVLRNPVGRVLIADSDVTPIAKRGLKAAMVDEARVTPALVRRFTDLLRAPGHRAILLGIDQGAPATPERLAAIRAPTLVMVGREDRLIPAADGQRFADAIPGAELIVYPGVGHLPMQQIPDRSAADLERWLAQKAIP
jgi:pimeloyl-ACP methyl ester carboxylesterase